MPEFLKPKQLRYRPQTSLVTLHAAWSPALLLCLLVPVSWSTLQRPALLML